MGVTCCSWRTGWAQYLWHVGLDLLLFYKLNGSCTGFALRLWCRRRVFLNSHRIFTIWIPPSSGYYFTLLKVGEREMHAGTIWRIHSWTSHCIQFGHKDLGWKEAGCLSLFGWLRQDWIPSLCLITWYIHVSVPYKLTHCDPCAVLHPWVCSEEHQKAYRLVGTWISGLLKKPSTRFSITCYDGSPGSSGMSPVFQAGEA